VTTDHPTPEALAEHLLDLLDVPPVAERPETVPWHEEPVAVVAIGRVEPSSWRGQDTAVFASGSAAALTPRYWAEQVRSPVRFADAVATLTANGVRTFLELGPDATLTTMIQACAPTATTIPALRARHPETRTITEAFGHLFAIGSTVDGRAFFPRAAPADLPDRLSA